jgi:hypothetical protein
MFSAVSLGRLLRLCMATTSAKAFRRQRPLACLPTATHLLFREDISPREQWIPLSALPLSLLIPQVQRSETRICSHVSSSHRCSAGWIIDMFYCR